MEKLCVLNLYSVMMIKQKKRKLVDLPQICSVE